jgi:hypothetical protein
MNTNQPTQVPINQPVPSSQAPAPQSSAGAQKSILKTVLIIIIALALIVAAIFGINYYRNYTAQKKVADRAVADKAIIQVIYDIRDSARLFYEKNQSYKEWWPASADLVKVSSLGSTVIYRKPDFQSYVIYAYSQTDQKYFCIDTTGFADFVDTITDSQIKCQ